MIKSTKKVLDILAQSEPLKYNRWMYELSLIGNDICVIMSHNNVGLLGYVTRNGLAYGESPSRKIPKYIINECQNILLGNPCTLIGVNRPFRNVQGFIRTDTYEIVTTYAFHDYIMEIRIKARQKLILTHSVECFKIFEYKFKSNNKIRIEYKDLTPADNKIKYKGIYFNS